MNEKELKAAIDKVDVFIAKKAYGKADKFIATLPAGVTRDQLNAKIKEARKARRVASQPGATTRPEKSIKVDPKLPSPEAILDAYDELIDILKKTEDNQRPLGKPYRIYFAHRIR